MSVISIKKALKPGINQHGQLHEGAHDCQQLPEPQSR